MVVLVFSLNGPWSFVSSLHWALIGQLTICYLALADHGIKDKEIHTNKKTLGQTDRQRHTYINGQKQTETIMKRDREAEGEREIEKLKKLAIT